MITIDSMWWDGDDLMTVDADGNLSRYIDATIEVDDGGDQDADVVEVIIRSVRRADAN